MPKTVLRYPAKPVNVINLNSKQVGISLTDAILLYGSDAATIHTVRLMGENKTPTIMPGVPLQADHLQQIIAKLADNTVSRSVEARKAAKGTKTSGEKEKRALSLDLGLLPPEALYADVSKFIFWVKPRRCEMFIDRKDFPKKSVINHPGFIFVIKTGMIYVFAVKGNKRPTAESELHQAPYFNVNNAGLICQGSANFVTVPHPSSIPPCEVAWFETIFTHSTAKRKITRCPSYKEYLKRVGGKGKKSNPDPYLVSLKMTLKDFIQGKSAASGQEETAQPLGGHGGAGGDGEEDFAGGNEE